MTAQGVEILLRIPECELEDLGDVHREMQSAFDAAGVVVGDFYMNDSFEDDVTVVTVESTADREAIEAALNAEGFHVLDPAAEGFC